MTKFRPFIERKSKLQRLLGKSRTKTDQSVDFWVVKGRFTDAHVCTFTCSNGFNKCVQWKLSLLEPTPLYSFVISLLNLTFAYFFMLNCENTEVIRWPLFSQIPRCNAILWQYLWTVYRDTPIFLNLRNIDESSKLSKKSKKIIWKTGGEMVTDLNIYSEGVKLL